MLKKTLLSLLGALTLLATAPMAYQVAMADEPATEEIGTELGGGGGKLNYYRTSGGAPECKDVCDNINVCCTLPGGA